MRLLAIITALLLTAAITKAAESEKGTNTVNTIITMKFNNEELTVRLNDSPASKDLVAMLPMTLTFRDYNQTEKVSDLPKSLSTDGSPSGCTPSIGDVTYYAPWGNLAIFYRNFSHSNGLIPLGAIESGVEKLASMQGSFSVRLEVKQ